MITDTPARRQAVERLEAKRGFRNHVSVYVIVSALLVVVWAAMGAGYFWPVWPMAGWAIGLVYHAWAVYFEHPATEEQIRREMVRSA